MQWGSLSDTPPLATDRRQFLGRLAAGIALGTAWPSLAPGRDVNARRWLCACVDPADNFGLAALDPAGGMCWRVPLPGRAHALVQHPRSPLAVALARRPGTFARLLNTGTGAAIASLQAAPDRHFYGHGAFSRDGTLFFTTENDYQAERGVIGVRRVAPGFEQVDEWYSGGIGPHEILSCRGGDTLFVANGGILTHPDSGRARLNLPSMEPSLLRLDAGSGRLMDALRLPDALHTLSIRHLAVLPGGGVAFAMQEQGLPSPARPQVGLWLGGDQLSLLDNHDGWHSAYVGSVAVDSAGMFLAASAPRDGRVGIWRLPAGRPVGDVPLVDACGLAATGAPGEFMVTSGEGEIARLSLGSGEPRIDPLATAPLSWDNHLLLLL
jgi:hypothetical protein